MNAVFSHLWQALLSKRVARSSTTTAWRGRTRLIAALQVRARLAASVCAEEAIRWDSSKRGLRSDETWW